MTSKTTSDVLAATPMLADASALHAQARSLDLNSWRVLAALTTIFAEVGATVPTWIAELLEHAKRLSREVPAVVFEALVGDDDGPVRCPSQPARHWGLEVGLWRFPDAEADVRRWGLARGYWTPVDLDVLVSLTPLGQIVREHCDAREERRRQAARPLATKLRLGEIMRTFKPWQPHEVPPVLEDGTRGVVSMKHETEDAGPVFLIRGTRCELLFHGFWATVGQARAYARHYGHRFAFEVGLAEELGLEESEP